MAGEDQSKYFGLKLFDGVDKPEASYARIMRYLQTLQIPPESFAGIFLLRYTSDGIREGKPLSTSFIEAFPKAFGINHPDAQVEISNLEEHMYGSKTVDEDDPQDEFRNDNLEEGAVASFEIDYGTVSGIKATCYLLTYNNNSLPFFLLYPRPDQKEQRATLKPKLQEFSAWKRTHRMLFKGPRRKELIHDTQQTDDILIRRGFVPFRLD